MRLKDTSLHVWQKWLQYFTPLNPPAKQVLDRLTEDLTELGAKRVIDSTAGTFMAVHVECDGVNNAGRFYTVAHYYEQNGSRMPDPQMSFLKLNDGTYYPLSYEQSGLNLVQEVVAIERNVLKAFRTKLQRQLVEFCDMWMENIRLQQFDAEPEGEPKQTVIQVKFPLG